MSTRSSPIWPVSSGCSPIPTSTAFQHIVAEGDVVMTERLDMIKGPDGSLHGVPVMGTFVVTDGKISRWTDYWDTSLPAKMMTGEDYSTLVPASY